MRDYHGPIPSAPRPASKPADTKKWVELTEHNPCPTCGEAPIALLVTEYTIEGNPRQQLASKQCRNACGSLV